MLETVNPSSQQHGITRLEAKLDNHENYLPKNELYFAMAALLLTVLLSTMDNSGTAISVSFIAKDMNISKSVQWMGTSFCISLTVFTVILGRFADIFGRKPVLIASLLVMGVFELACALAVDETQLYVFRSLVGVGSAGANSVSILLVTDLVPFEQRATYQGLLGIGLGSGDLIGPLLMSGFISSTAGSWRNFYFLMFPLMVAAAALVYFFVPYSSSKLTKGEMLRNIDYLGFLLSTAFLVFLLLPVDNGGLIWDWSDPKIAVFLALALVSLALFLVVEWKFAAIPTVPLRVFKFAGVTNILVQSILYGIVFNGMVFYLPYYYIIIREYLVTKTAVMSVCWLIPLALNSYNAGKIVTKLQNYKYILVVGYICWFVGSCLMLLLDQETSVERNVFIMVLIGVGVGFTFQPSIIAIQAQSLKADKSVVVTTRNVFRSLGNSMGIALGSLIYSTSLQSKVKAADFLTAAQKDFIINNLNSKIDLSQIITDPNVIPLAKELYMDSLKNVFVSWMPLMGLCLVMSLFIKDSGLKSIDHTEATGIELEKTDNLMLVNEVGEDTDDKFDSLSFGTRRTLAVSLENSPNANDKQLEDYEIV
ncbi:hypothetical protein WICPIJ_003205 [Wickerhamomyces pijperi]|uniref:Major facilitator superfamily (MFS) profile domain-containing protein n=1 Tax=Wickerhamomyces pijperi TaxID=599730 RepID=A0A9P8TN80_WICPI|nr:hypothetical protein WICPIJ_003205 [Wickerhamomyces pijperi]